MPVTVTIQEARSAIVSAVRAGVVPFLEGSPGAGKSAIIHSIASDFDLELIDLRLSQCDPTDLLGFPAIDEREAGDKRARYVPMSTFPLEGDALPTKPDGTTAAGWLLFLDELNHAERAVQKAGYKLVLDRMVGARHLHPNVAVVAAGNLDTDGAFTESMSTAMQSRLCHLTLEISNDEWLDWAAEHGIDHRITSYIKYKPVNLYRFDPDHAEKTYPSPRTWEFTSRLVRDAKALGREMLPLIAGTIGEGAAREFIAFTRIYQGLLTLPEILKDPGSVAVPTEPSVLYALTGACANGATEANLTPLMTFIARLPVEFQVITMREVYRRHSSLIKHPAVVAWATKSAHDLF